MNWEAVGAVGEVVAAITVLITLIYLSLQVRSVKEQTSSAAHQYEFNGYSINQRYYFSFADRFKRFSGYSQGSHRQ